MNRGVLGSDTVFAVLRNPRRRRLLRALRSAEHECDIGPLATELASIEARDRADSDPPDRVPDDSRLRKSVYVALSQVHVPMLERTGAVTVEGGRRLQLTGTAGVFFAHLDIVDERRRSTPPRPDGRRPDGGHGDH